MSLKKSLALVENKSYRPVYTGNVNNNSYLSLAAQQQRSFRPQTGLTSKSFSAFASRPTTSLTSVSANRSTTSTSSRRLKSSAILDTQKSQGSVKEALPGVSALHDDYDIKSQASTNISLFSTAATERTVPKMRAYNQFNYNSYFERYLNRRLPVKLLYMPPQRTSDDEAPVLEPSLYEVLDKEELDRIFGMHDVTQARPCRIRSISISNEQPSKRNEKIINTFKKISRPIGLVSKATRSNSLVPFSILKTEIHSNSETATVETKRERESDQLDFVSARGIKYPKVDFFNTKVNYKMQVRSKSARLSKRDLLYNKNDQYSHVKSRLGEYLSSSNVTSNSNKSNIGDRNKNNTRRTKSAIETFYFTSAYYLNYTKSNQIDVNSYLKLSKELENMVKSDRKPVYFGELIQENIDAHTKGPRFGLWDKFYNISEWLKTMNQDDCAHFFSNPFTSEKSTCTEDLEQDSEQTTTPTEQEMDTIKMRPRTSVIPSRPSGTLSSDAISFNNSPIPIRMFATAKLKIDPFQNPKNVLLKNRVLAQKSEIDHPNNRIEYRESAEKQTLVAQKEYTQLLSVKKRFTLGDCDRSRLKSNQVRQRDVFRSESKYFKSESNLAKQKSLNDLILTRMELGLFIF